MILRSFVKRFLSSCIVALIAASSSSSLSALAATFEWTDPVNGDFSDASRWTPTGGPPAVGDEININEAGSYTITLTQNESANLLLHTAGNVILQSDSTTQRTLNIATGTLSVEIRDGASLSIDNSQLNSGGDVLVDGGSLVTSNNGVFTLTAGKDFTASNESQVLFEGTYAILDQQKYIIDSRSNLTTDLLQVLNGTNNRFEVKDFGSSLDTTVLEVGDADKLGDMWVLGSSISSSSTHIGHTGSGVSALAVVGGSNASLGLLTIAAEDNQIGTFSAQTSSITATSAIVGNSVSGQGTVSLVASTFRLNDLTINATGQVSMINTARIFATLIDNNHGGSFDFQGGALTVKVFTGDLVNQGGTLAPANLPLGTPAGSTTIVGDYTQQANTKLAIDIGGILQANEHDFINVTGTALFEGDLQLSLIDDFIPQATDMFTILTANNLAGLFDNVNSGERLTTDDGIGSFVVDFDYGNDQIVLSDFELTFSADFDTDGDVDSDDLVQWESDYGADGSDADEDGDSDGKDFLIWQRQFSSGDGGLGLTSLEVVPEPSAASLLFLSIICHSFVLRRIGAFLRFATQ